LTKLVNILLYIPTDRVGKYFREGYDKRSRNMLMCITAEADTYYKGESEDEIKGVR
jgi:hypothetical protein